MYTRSTPTNVIVRLVAILQRRPPQPLPAHSAPEYSPVWPRRACRTLPCDPHTAVGLIGPVSRAIAQSLPQPWGGAPFLTYRVKRR